jgi:hypothetical protein
MSITHTRVHLLAAMIACGAASALLLLSADTAQADPGISGHHGPGGTVGIGNPNDLPPARAFNPQPDPPAFSDPGSRVGLGGPDTLPPSHH